MPLFSKRRYSTIRATPKRQIPEGLWIKCKNCGVVLYRSKIDENQQVCTECGYHYPITPEHRISMLTDDDADTFREMDGPMASTDPLQFAGGQIYPEKLESAREKTGLNEAIVCGETSLNKQPIALTVMDFRFMGASMGSVVGEKFARLTEHATKNNLPLVAVTASGGARMQEGMFSLMQMAKTSGSLAAHKSEGLPYIVIMTHPTTAGVSASFASLGDVILAESGALIGFAGPRVIKQTTQSDLPEGFQKAEFLLDHGFIDRVVHRNDLRRELGLLLEYLGGAKD